MEFTQTQIEIMILSLQMAKELAGEGSETRKAVDTIDEIIQKLEKMQGDENETEAER